MATTTLERPTDRASEHSTVPAWLGLARIGAIVMVVFAFALQITARTVIPPVLVIGLVFLAFIPFLNGERRRVGLGAAVFAAAAWLGNLPIIIDDLANPESAPAFILQLLSTVGAALVLVAGVAAFLRRPARMIRPLALAAVAVFLAGSVGSVAAAANTDSAVAQAGDVKVTAQQIMWAPEDIVIDSSATGIWIENKDGVRHTFTIPELGIDVEVPGLKSSRVDIDAAPGTYQIICDVPGHQNMTGTLTITG
ncbi:MAG: cupredoxin domain-containing protein [Acidimicrobiia bacterium]|nr:cupredoxin domain-containing protein [Acidimicrobiia bacterium]